ncbi:type II toxin-antitoxin system RelE/ParE family toxin [Mangrovivirga cuniculi]|uniref:Type II toxin-antitoxin system RelE/ParE family toxin n=1 Tax=Mangrovivirga cuniculi TaxID=2715131 RepID=A0A4D7JDN2_9BACT|nr:type II toxin-antitoxin system RelE/ParE family toxin [Mangrovivirga cuniculi]QCK13781.1 type II toxin-antitoxin system RelE/ParE family toxin [Mangrovivirga cuniculi]
MAEYRLSNEAKNDLIRIHQYGVKQFGESQADKYFNTFYNYFDIIAERPFSFESVDFIKEGYRRCVCGFDSIFFRVNNNVVEIMAIIGRQDATEILK